MIRPIAVAFIFFAFIPGIGGLAARASAGNIQSYLTGQDLFAIEQAIDPQISPDGHIIAFVRSAPDIMADKMRGSIWLVDTRTGSQTPLVVGKGSHSQPRWSPSGDRLAYISSAEERPQIYVRWMATGVTLRITGLTSAPSSIAWSPDGRNIAYTMIDGSSGGKPESRLEKPEGAEWAPPLETYSQVAYRTDAGGYVKPGHRQIFTVSAAGGAPRQLSHGAYNHNGPLAWSADGRHILFSGNLSPEWERQPLESEIYQLALLDGAVTPLTKREGPDGSPAPSPDGRYVAYVGYDDRHLSYRNTQLYLMDRDGRNIRPLTPQLDRAVTSPRWASDSRSLYVQYTDRGRTKLARVSLSGAIETLTSDLSGEDLDRPYTGGSFSVARSGAVAFMSGSASRPADISLLRDGKAVRLTDLNAGLLSRKILGETRKLSVLSSVDRRRIDAWLVTPPAFDPGRKYPLILEIHGGPFDSYGANFSTDNQLYAAAGYVVLYANPRGSTSYGEDFANLIHRNFPGPDYGDLMSAVDAAVRTGFVDSGQLFVTGGSAGGLLSAWIIGKTDRFRAAALQKPVVNWVSMALTSDSYVYIARYWFAKPPWEDPESYWKRSPLSLVGNIHTPTLVVTGTEDFRSPASEAEQFYQALQLKGVATALIRVPGASHGSLAERPSQSADRVSAIINWFDRYRNASPPKGSTR